MTILSTSQLAQVSQSILWRVATAFRDLNKWLSEVEKAERLGGESEGIGNLWRFRVRRNAGHQVVEAEITEWIEGERFGMRPVRQTGVFDGVQVFQVVFDFKKTADNETEVCIQCEYEPVTKFGRLKNLAYFRRRLLDFLDQLTNSLIAVAKSEQHEVK